MTITEGLSKFEQCALELILRMEAPEYENHIQYLLVEKRENTGVGLYVDFSYMDNELSSSGNNRTLGETVHAEIAGLEHGAGLVLYIDQGKITTLEACCYADDRWPDEIVNFEIRAL